MPRSNTAYRILSEQRVDANSPRVSYSDNIRDLKHSSWYVGLGVYKIFHTVKLIFATLYAKHSLQGRTQKWTHIKVQTENNKCSNIKKENMKGGNITPQTTNTNFPTGNAERIQLNMHKICKFDENTSSATEIYSSDKGSRSCSQSRVGSSKWAEECLEAVGLWIPPPCNKSCRFYSSVTAATDPILTTRTTSPEVLESLVPTSLFKW